MPRVLLPAIACWTALLGPASAAPELEKALTAPQRGGIPAAAKPYVETRSFVSPLTGESFSAAIQSRRVPIPSYDYDFCPHPPFNSLAFTLVTDPVTGWTDYPETFSQPCPLTAEQLKSALGDPKFNRRPPEGLPWLTPYPWEQFENAALQAKALEQNGAQVGNWYLQAAWAVRLDVIAGSNEFDGEVAALTEKLPRPRANPQELLLPYELQLAAHWEQLRDSSVLTEVNPAHLALALAWLYRSRGELAAAERWLDEAAAADSAVRQELKLYGFMRSSIELERSYLQDAQRYFAQGWEQGVNAQRAGMVAFTLAEIARRLADLPAARFWYGQARIVQRGELNLDRLARLEEMANGRGY